ncbi:MAG: hypothetical protein U0457_13995 [Candidatus Sericytochromatia bacterium]
MVSRSPYLNFLPYNPKKLFGNWNYQFYKNYDFDISSLDSADNFPTQFFVTKQKIKETFERQEKKIHLVITAVGTGSIVDLIEQHLDELENYIQTITLTDLKDINLNRWNKINNSQIVLKKQIGDITNIAFIQSLSGDMFYGNELFGDIPNRFIYKNNDKYYDIWIRAYSPNNMPKIIEKQMRNILKGIYYKNKFPDVFTPEIGKILSFDIALKRRIFSYEINNFYQDYPNDCIIAVPDVAYRLLFEIYQTLNKRGTILFHDYGFFSQENLHLINNFLNRANTENPFVRNYYGEFTTDPAFDFIYHKLKVGVKNISIKKTAELVSNITNTPLPLVNLDGSERTKDFFLELIKERFEVWNIKFEIKSLELIIEEFINSLKNNTCDFDFFTKKLNQVVNNILNESHIITIKKILLGYFNDDDHRFITIEINK